MSTRLEPPSSTSNEISQGQKYWKRFKEEPLVPVGIGLTCTALLAAQKAIKQGNFKRANRFFRYRVYAQGLTVVAMLLGGIYYGEKRKKERQSAQQQQQEINKKRQQDWIRDLEEYNKK